jgi:hypothetical protein
MNINTLRAACAVATVVAAMTAGLQAEDASLAAARELYGSAAYADALKMLDGLAEGRHAPEDGRAIGLYRVLCLIALDRGAEANRAVDALIARDPLYRPSANDLSPRMRTTFTEARKRMLPAIVQQDYVEAKAAFDRRDFVTAAGAFKRVLDELADPDIALAASQGPLSDLRTLAVGFHDLSVKASAPPPAPAPTPAPVPAPAPAPAVVVQPAIVAPVRDFRRLYSADNPDVVPPTTVRQAFPAFPARGTSAAVGLVEILIDATGAVESAAMRVPIHPNYDSLVLSAAKKWQYEPATLDGVPVRFMKRVRISVTATPGL